MATQTRSAQQATKRRRGWSVAFLLSAGLHLVVLGWFGLKRAVTEWRADPPAVNVQIVRLPTPPPIAAAESSASTKPAASRASRTAEDQTAPSRQAATGAAGPGVSASPGLTIDPRWAVDMSLPQPPARRELDVDEFQPCDPLKDPRRESKACRKVDEIAESVGRFYDPQRGRTAAAREARRNENLRRYRAAPGTSGYPGIGCAVLHRC